MWEVVVVAKPGGYGGPAPKSKIGGGRAPSLSSCGYTCRPLNAVWGYKISSQKMQEQPPLPFPSWGTPTWYMT